MWIGGEPLLDRPIMPRHATVSSGHGESMVVDKWRKEKDIWKGGAFCPYLQMCGGCTLSCVLMEIGAHKVVVGAGGGV